MACGGMIFVETFSNFRKKNVSFYFISLIFFYVAYVITAPETLKGSRNFQDFALIRAVLFLFNLLRNTKHSATLTPKKVEKMKNLKCGGRGRGW